MPCTSVYGVSIEPGKGGLLLAYDVRIGHDIHKVVGGELCQPRLLEGLFRFRIEFHVGQEIPGTGKVVRDGMIEQAFHDFGLGHLLGDLLSVALPWAARRCGFAAP